MKESTTIIVTITVCFIMGIVSLSITSKERNKPNGDEVIYTSPGKDKLIFNPSYNVFFVEDSVGHIKSISR